MAEEDINPFDENGSDDRLTPQQARFVQYRASGMTAKDAALKAGYSEAVANNTYAHLISKPKIQRAIYLLVDQQMLSAGVTADSLTAKLLGMVNLDEHIHKFYDADFKPFPPEMWTPEMRACVKGVKKSVNQFGENVVLEFHDPQRAIETLAKLKGLIDKPGTADVAPDEMATQIRDLLQRMNEADGLAEPTTRH